MSDDANALMALKNAWTGAISASQQVAEVAPTVMALPDSTPIAELDLERYHQLTLAQSNAVMALRGLVEQLKRRGEPPTSQ